MGKQAIYCNISLHSHLEAIVIPPNQTYELILDYPLGELTPYRCDVKARKNGMNEVGLLIEIFKAYDDVYSHCEKYGVWGHEKDDLVVEGIEVDHAEKTVALHMGS